ncbi:hypothetical protein MGN70_013157 [Eutypa lata]|nr:hypothetical protein MGN70_013157 [Eutypa lata]
MAGRTMSNSSDVSPSRGASSPSSPDLRSDDVILSTRPSPTGFLENQRLSPRSPHMHWRPPPKSGTVALDSSLLESSPKTAPARSRPIAIELPTTKKVNSAPVYTPPAPLSARGDLPGGYFPLHEEQSRVYHPHPFQLDVSKARRKSIQLAASRSSSSESHVTQVSNVTATGTIATASSANAPAATTTLAATMSDNSGNTYLQQPSGANTPDSRSSTPLTSYNPTPYQENTLPIGKYYPSNYEKRKRQKHRPQVSDITSSPMKSDTHITTTRPAQMAAAHSRNESEAKRRLAQYQRDMIAQAAMAIGGSNVNRASVPSISNMGFSHVHKPDKPRLQPLGSPGPVTPMELEGADGYLDARGSAEESQREEIARAVRLDEERRRREGASSPIVELGPSTC